MSVPSVVVAVALALAPVPADAQNFRFSNFSVEGNTRIQAETILAYAGIAPGATVSAAQVNDALQRLQATGLFEEVEILPRGGTLVIQVREYPAINRIAIEGNRRLDDEDLLAMIDSQPRRVYSPAVAEADAATIAEAYRQSGRLTATVNPVIIRRDDNRVDLVFEVAEGRVVETQRISFVGNREYSDRRLRQVLESTQAGLFNALIRSDTFIDDRIALDRQLLTDFYQDRGYVDFEILSVTPELSRDRGAYFVTFNIREGQSFDIGRISVVSEIPEANADQYRDVIRIREGVTYSPRLVDNTISRMENLATQQGLRFVRIEPRVTRNPASLTLDLEFVISRGERVFVERIDIEGNATTLDRVIRRQFDTVEGDPFDPRAIRQAAERIRATGFFADVQVEGRQGSAPDQVVVDVDVEEQPTGSLGFSASYSSDTGAGLAVNFSENNFLGRGQRLAFAFNTVEGGQSASFSFIEPNFMARDVGLGMSLGYSQTTGQDRAYDTEDYTLGTSISFPLSELGRLRISYDLSQNEISDVPDGSSAIIRADEDAGARIASILGISYAYDSRDAGLNPNAGVRLQFGAEYAGLGGDAEFIRARALAIAETSVMREEVSLRATFEGGALYSIDGDSRQSDRFYLSSRQMRGFDTYGMGPRDLAADNEDALGGNYFAVARFEAGFPLGLPEEYGITGGVFYDIGTVWGLDNTAGGNADGSTNGTVDDDLYWRQAIGVSIFWDTVLGPLRFNFSHALDTQPYDRTREFDFTVEARF
ncbi:Outer membrane protein assembly factor YaeT precursor [Roseibacterium elongatum DSM 19469]|uniref:Outer membrane protein assembly factor BamA n=1 Tax=Roseicyclus elongatus DSM 19469 TaxID=1294273 RepID=W8RUU0_9RHOB|nr:outer membrane protein assembly factor BamA [Roseibacterium elongatum]AHM05003.1 Outer membrane protein assembly factor YaeT precursor [Roseibacterium elongatum DSM 19469]